MLMPKVVIVPLDGSTLAERALAPGQAIARATGAELVPMIVVVDELYKKSRAYLLEACEGLDVPIRNPTVLRSINAVECIANAGEEEGSLIVMSSHGNTGIRRAVFGSVAARVIATLRRPVVVLGPSFSGDFEPEGGRMMIPLDGSREAETILPAVTNWCQEFGTEPWLISVVDPALPVPAGTHDTSYVHSVAHDLEASGLTAGWDVLRHSNPSDPAGPLVTFSLGLPARIVAMTTHGRGGLRRVVTGGVAARLVRDVACPLLILRPDEEDVDTH